MNESSTVYLLPQTPPRSFVLTILQLNVTYNLLFIYTYWYSFFTYWVFTNLPFNVFQQVLPTLLKIRVLKLYWTISLQFDNPRINMDNFTETIFNKKKKEKKKSLKAHVKENKLCCSDYPFISFKNATTT